MKRIANGLPGLILPLILLLPACNRTEKHADFYHPAEFEPNNSTCFIWSTDYYEIIPRLAGIISQRDKVTIFTGNSAKTGDIQNFIRKHHGNSENIRFVRLSKNYDNIWIRDYGPYYLVNRPGDKKLVQFMYFWTYPGFIDDFASVMNLPIVSSDLNGTGGAREVNGKGTLILCETHELDVNHPKTRQEIENEMIEKLCLKKIIWLKRGIPQDDSFLSGPIYGQVYPKGVNGHVDEFCRFADPRTILISSVTEEEAGSNPIFSEAKRRLDENYDILKSSTDQDGKKFKIIKVPIAPVLISDRRAGPEKTFVASITSYMNFIITNSLIILPSYVSEDSDNIALMMKEKKVTEIFQEVFPEREIIKVRADTINYYSGGFHCISIHEPQPPSVR
ncbi:MAG: agmatine deiminase family protein [Bacteroidales bacterium]|nr:agmatine deiminase family protein [Bacteroidales bacterium]